MSYRKVEITDELKDRIGKHIWNYTLGIIRIENDPKGVDIHLIGSGVLVKVGGILGILTAHHVMEVLPTEGKIGLVFQGRTEQRTIDVKYLNPVKVGRETNNKSGPDLAILIISSHRASIFTSVMSFYNLERNRDELLSDKIDIKLGSWVSQGFVDERTSCRYDTPRARVEKKFCMFASFGHAESYVIRNSHDYLLFPIDTNAEEDLPINYGGISGSGLWQVTLKEIGSDEVIKDQVLLRGMSYYQDPLINGISALRCHAHKSLYKVVYNKMLMHR